MSTENYITFYNTTVHVVSEALKRSHFPNFSFLKSEFGTNDSEKNKKILERAEMVKRRGVDRKVDGFKVKKARN